ncbi:MAG: NAD-dependent epimerase/dehydratase family protein [Steroidobacteraceae bacterium]
MRVPVVINGAENFVGRRLLARLEQSDWARALPVASGNAAALRQSLTDARAVAHCAVGSAKTIADSAKSLYASLAEVSTPMRVVHLSSSTVYGSLGGVVSERDRCGAALGAYAQAQLDAEALAARYRGTVILRSAAEFGPGCPHWSGRIARLLRSHRLGDLGAAGDGYCNLTFIDDLIAAISVALRQEAIEGEVFNIALDYKPTWNEYFVSFARALGAVPVKRISSRRLKLESRCFAAPLKVMEIAFSRVGIRGMDPPVPIAPSFLRLCSQELILDVSKAEQILGLRWTPFQAALQSAAADCSQ